jgi:2'-5' RNA ligase
VPIGNRYALWLTPAGDAAATLAGVIAELGARHGGPRFAPHVTLLGRLLGEEAALAQTAERLAAGLAPLRLRLAGFAGEPYYFRCLYAQLEPGAALRRAHATAARAYGGRPVDDYLPHLSLFYGRLDGAEKERLYGGLAGSVPAEFAVDRLQLVHITVGIGDWRVVADAPLTGTAGA